MSRPLSDSGNWADASYRQEEILMKGLGIPGPRELHFQRGKKKKEYSPEWEALSSPS